MNQRGGAVYGLLAAIGFVVVLMAVIFAVCMGNAGAAQHSFDRVDHGQHGTQVDRLEIQAVSHLVIQTPRLPPSGLFRGHGARIGARYDDDCQDYGDCGYDERDGDGGDYQSGGPRGNRGRSGDNRGKDSCRSFCHNVIIVPDPRGGGQQQPGDGGGQA